MVNLLIKFYFLRKFISIIYYMSIVLLLFSFGKKLFVVKFPLPKQFKINHICPFLFTYIIERNARKVKKDIQWHLKQLKQKRKNIWDISNDLLNLNFYKFINIQSFPEVNLNVFFFPFWQTPIFRQMHFPFPMIPFRALITVGRFSGSD